MNSDISRTLQSIRNRKNKKFYRRYLPTLLVTICILINVITFWALCKENQIHHIEITYQLELLKLQLN